MPHIAVRVEKELAQIEGATADARRQSRQCRPGTAYSFGTMFDRYELWDMFILPIDRISGGGERSRSLACEPRRDRSSA
jgi:hypothetical protein